MALIEISYGPGDFLTIRGEHFTATREPDRTWAIVCPAARSGFWVKPDELAELQSILKAMGLP